MREMVQMVVVLTVLAAASGGLLAAIEQGTKDKIESQVLNFVVGPALKDEALRDVENDPTNENSRFKIKDQDSERWVFVGVLNSEPTVAVLEASAAGFADKIGVVVGFNVTDDTLHGVAVTTHAETPGLGANAKENPAFVRQFKGFPLKAEYKVSADGGEVNAMSGATITSRAVAQAVSSAAKAYERLKPEIIEKMKDFPK